LRKTILLLVSIFTVTSLAFAQAANAFDQQYPRHQHPHPPQQPAQPAQQPAGPTLDDLKARNFTVRTLDGRSVSLNSLLEQGKPVLMDFWATWCGPCRMVIPHMAELSRKYGKDGLIVIGMNLEEPDAQGQAVRNFVKRSRMDYQNVFAQHAIYQFFSGNAVARIPYTLLFGPDGKLIWRLVGYSPQMSVALNSAVQQALAAAAEKPSAPPAPAPEKQAEQVAPEKSAEQPAPEKPAEKPAEQPAPEKPEEKAPETPVEQSAPEKPMERPLEPTLEPRMPEKPAEESALEKPAEPIAPEKPAERPAPEKPAEPVTPEKPVEKGTPEKPAEQLAPEKPAEQSAPTTKKNCCDCPCCSSREQEKKTEQGAPEKPERQ
jgi:thiol-disulfide isomerase/thioredoxin